MEPCAAPAGVFRFGVQCAENIDRDLPTPVRRLRTRVLRDAAFVAARSESAARLVRAWGARARSFWLPCVPDWQVAPSDAGRSSGPARSFTVGYAGRLWRARD